MIEMNPDVKLVRDFIDGWLSKDHGVHTEWSIVQDMKLLLERLDESIEMNDDE